MLEVLQFYVSGFWIWLGITMGGCMILTCLSGMIEAIIRGRK